MKKPITILALFCIAYFLRAEWLVYQHYIVVNRDFYPIMSEFYRMYAERALNLAGQLAALWMGWRVSLSPLYRF